MRISDWSSDVCSSDLGIAKGENEIGGLAGAAGGAEDRAIVFAQNLEPRSDIIGVAHGGHDAERGADEGGGDFGAQFLARIGLRSEAARLVAAQSLGVAGPVREFVKGGAIEIDLIAEGGLRRHGHEIRSEEHTSELQ